MSLKSKTFSRPHWLIIESIIITVKVLVGLFVK